MANFFTDTLRNLKNSLTDDKGLIRRVNGKTYFMPPSQLRQPTQNVWNTIGSQNQALKTTFEDVVSPYVQNRYVEPVMNIPNAYGNLTGENKTWGQRGKGGLELLGGVASLFPDPVGDIALPVFDAWKGYNRSALKGGTFKERLHSAKTALTLEDPAGLGDAISTNETGKDALNIGELPLLLMAGGIKNINKQGTSVKRVAEASKGDNWNSMSKVLTNTLKRFTTGSSDAFKTKTVSTSGKFLPLDEAKNLLQSQDDVDVSALQNIYNTLSRSTMYKKFDKQKALDSLPYYVDKLGGDRILQIKRTVLGNKRMTPDLVKKFWKTLNSEAKVSKRFIDDGSSLSLLNSVDDMLGNTKTNIKRDWKLIDGSKEKTLSELEIIDGLGSGGSLPNNAKKVLREMRFTADEIRRIGNKEMSAFDTFVEENGLVFDNVTNRWQKGINRNKTIEPSKIVNTPSQAENVSTMLKNTPQKRADDIYGTTRSIMDDLPDKETAKTTSDKSFFEWGKDNIKESFKEIEKNITKYISKEDFVDIIEGTKVTKNPVVQRMVDTHRKIVSDLREFTENPNIGDFGSTYFPHSLMTKTKQAMDQIFPDVWIDQINTLGGHFKQRKGTLEKYSKDYVKVMGDYAEQVLYEKYRGSFKTQRTGVQEVIDHVQKLENESMDYIGQLATKVPKAIIEWKTRSNFLGGPMRTYNNIFNQFKKVAPEMTKRFNLLRDNEFNQRQWLKEIEPMMNNPDNVYKYIGEKIFNIEPKEMNSWIASVRNGAQQMGNERMISELLYQSKKVALQDFIEEAAKYKYKHGSTKDIINDFIDGQLKKQSLEPALLDSLTNHLISNFYRSHLGLNLKTSLLQSLEVIRIPATYSLKAFVKGLEGSFFDFKRLKDTYGFDEVKPHYLIEDFNIKTKPNLGKELGDKVDSVLMKPIQVMENWKNRVYAGAAESEGLAKGLKGQELVDHVRDSVYKYAHIADEFNTPAFLMSKNVIGESYGKKGLLTQGTFNRALFQYGQFAIKNTFTKVDALQQKELGKLFGLLLADVVNIAIVSTAFNVGKNQIENLIGSFLPTGFGPIFQVPYDLIEAYRDNEEKKEQGYSTNYSQSVIRRISLGSFVPAGTQYLKSEGAANMIAEGSKDTSSGLVAYPKSENEFANFMALLFGPQVTPEARDYKSQDYLRENQSNIYKQLYETDPAKAYEYYYSQKDRRSAESAKKKGIEAILKGDAKSANIFKQEDGSYVIPVPSGAHKTVEEMLMADKAYDDKVTEVRAIMNRTGSYKGADQSPETTQQFFEMNELTDQDYNIWLAKDTVSKLKGKQRADGLMDLITKRGMSLTDLYKMDALTKTAIDDLEKYGYIKNADALWKKIQMTDPYFAKQEMKKVSIDKMEKILKNRADVQKKLINQQAETMQQLLKQTTKQAYKSPTIKQQKVSQAGGKINPVTMQDLLRGTEKLPQINVDSSSMPSMPNFNQFIP